MKQLFILFCFFIFCTSAFSQSYKYKYFLDKNLASTDSNFAVLIGKGLKDSGLFLLDCYDKRTGILLMSAHFTDSSLNTLKGNYKIFYNSGIAEQEGNYENNAEEGLWLNRNPAGLITDSIIYVKGKRASLTRLTYYPDGKLMTRNVFDSAGKGKSLSKYDIKGNEITVDKVFTKVEVEARYPGGPQAYVKFLQQNLRPELPAEKGAPTGTYTVIVKFIVDIDGSISEIIPETKNGYGMEEEVVRIITLSPRWEPAMQDGNIVRAYRRQPVTFIVSTE